MLHIHWLLGFGINFKLIIIIDWPLPFRILPAELHSIDFDSNLCSSNWAKPTKFLPLNKIIVNLFLLIKLKPAMPAICYFPPQIHPIKCIGQGWMAIRANDYIECPIFLTMPNGQYSPAIFPIHCVVNPIGSIESIGQFLKCKLIYNFEKDWKKPSGIAFNWFEESKRMERHCISAIIDGNSLILFSLKSNIFSRFNRLNIWVNCLIFANQPYFWMNCFYFVISKPKCFQWFHLENDHRNFLRNFVVPKIQSFQFLQCGQCFGQIGQTIFAQSQNAQIDQLTDFGWQTW